VLQQAPSGINAWRPCRACNGNTSRSVEPARAYGCCTTSAAVARNMPHRWDSEFEQLRSMRTHLTNIGAVMQPGVCARMDCARRVWTSCGGLVGVAINANSDSTKAAVRKYCPHRHPLASRGHAAIARHPLTVLPVVLYLPWEAPQLRRHVAMYVSPQFAARRRLARVLANKTETRINCQ